MTESDGIWKSAVGGLETRSLSGWGYNCVGMVFAARRTWIDLDQLPMILKEDGYREIENVNDLIEGDLVVYYFKSGAVHIGVVIKNKIQQEGVDLKTLITVLSKWGADGEYIHDMNSVPTLLGKPTKFFSERISL